jgi:hypothetical protein
VGLGIEGAMAVASLSGMAGGFAGGFIGAALNGASLGQCFFAGYFGGVTGGVTAALTAGAMGALGSIPIRTRFAGPIWSNKYGWALTPLADLIPSFGNILNGIKNSVLASSLGGLGGGMSLGTMLGVDFAQGGGGANSDTWESNMNRYVQNQILKSIDIYRRNLLSQRSSNEWTSESIEIKMDVDFNYPNAYQKHNWKGYRFQIGIKIPGQDPISADVVYFPKALSENNIVKDIYTANLGDNGLLPAGYQQTHFRNKRQASIVVLLIKDKVQHNILSNCRLPRK